MSYFLGIDTSNYTTSVALFNDENNQVINLKKLLPVKEGEKGICCIFAKNQRGEQVLLYIGD